VLAALRSCESQVVERHLHLMLTGGQADIGEGVRFEIGHSLQHGLSGCSRHAIEDRRVVVKDGHRQPAPRRDRRHRVVHELEEVGRGAGQEGVVHVAAGPVASFQPALASATSVAQSSGGLARPSIFWDTA